jgi:translocator assembly and maintenance protein 41
MEPVLKRCLTQLQNRWGPLFQQQVLNIVAYGSGALPQSSSPSVMASNTLDLLIEVRNSSYFHNELMRSNQNDYSGFGYVMGAGWVNFATEKIFPMHSNHINLDGRKVKYSVIGKQQFREDMRNWKYLSFAGRMQKAVIPLQPYQENFAEDLQRNRESALAVALLLKKRAQDVHFGEIL